MAAMHAPAWAPLRWPIFRALWIAALASNVGTWIHDVAATWMMTTLTPSPILIALVPSASTLPIFLLALMAGALADIVDRRRLLLASQCWMLAVSGALGLLTLGGVRNPWVLLAATFALGCGTALNAPAWQAIIPELVARDELQAALTLNGLGINVARAVGPACGGLVVASLGPGAAFLLNAASFLGVVLVLFAWDAPARPTRLPGERLAGALRAGLRYARHSADLRRVLLRAASFILCASALWALLPVIVRDELHRGPGDYGFLLGCLGLGAVGGALLLPRARSIVSSESLVAAATPLVAIALLVFALRPSPAACAIAMALAGVAWITVLTAFHSGAQAALAPWVRGRGLAVYLVVFFGGLALGSALWGAVAEWIGARPACLVAAIALLIGLAATARVRLPSGAAHDAAPPRHWPTSSWGSKENGDEGPVLVTVEYRIDPAHADAFARAMDDVRRFRLRDGATRWDLLNDPSKAGRCVESFLVDSWVEHLRQHERITAADRDTEQRARRFHVGPQPPAISHFIARALPK